MIMEKMITKFEDYIEKNHSNGIWKNYIEIENITGIELHDVIKNVDNNYLFCKNQQGLFTTRKMYEKYTNFWLKFLDSYVGEYH